MLSSADLQVASVPGYMLIANPRWKTTLNQSLRPYIQLCEEEHNIMHLLSSLRSTFGSPHTCVVHQISYAPGR